MSKGFKFLLWLVIFFGVVFTAYILVYETSLFFGKPDSIITQKIRLDPDEYGGVITLVREMSTPIAMEWVSFNEETMVNYAYFSKTSNLVNEKEYYVHIPSSAKKGVYRYGIRVHYDGGKVHNEVKSFRVV